MNVFDSSKEEEIAESMDTVLAFKWTTHTTQRARLMYMKKGRGILPTLERDNIANFETQITPMRGFEIGNVKRIRGRI